jgi:hypothetical protein
MQCLGHRLAVAIKTNEEQKISSRDDDDDDDDDDGKTKSHTLNQSLH